MTNYNEFTELTNYNEFTELTNYNEFTELTVIQIQKHSLVGTKIAMILTTSSFLNNQKETKT